MDNRTRSFFVLGLVVLGGILLGVVVTYPDTIPEPDESIVVVVNPPEVESETPIPSSPAPPKPEPAPEIPFEVRIQEIAFEKTNAERRKQNLPLLTFDPILLAVATLHSTDMLQKDYFDHTDPNGCGMVCRLDRANYDFRAAGENIHFLGTRNRSPEEVAERVVTGWMSSPGHRENILDAEFTHSAVGVAISGNEIYATALYTKPQ